MDTQLIAMYTALIYQQVAIMEAMKAANSERSHRNEAMAYPEDEFLRVADELSRLAESLRY